MKLKRVMNVNPFSLTNIYKYFLSANGIRKDLLATLYIMLGGQRVVFGEDLMLGLYIESIYTIDKRYEGFRKLQMTHSKELNKHPMNSDLRVCFEKEEVEYYVNIFKLLLKYYNNFVKWEFSDYYNYEQRVYKYEFTSEDMKIKGSLNLMPQYLLGSIQTNFIDFYSQSRQINGGGVLTKNEVREIEMFREELLTILRSSNYKLQIENLV